MSSSRLLNWCFKNSVYSGREGQKYLLPVTSPPTSYVIQQPLHYSHGERGLFRGEVGLFCPPETTDIVIQQGSFLHTYVSVAEAQNLGHFPANNREQMWVNQLLYGSNAWKESHVKADKTSGPYQLLRTLGSCPQDVFPYSFWVNLWVLKRPRKSCPQENWTCNGYLKYILNFTIGGDSDLGKQNEK